MGVSRLRAARAGNLRGTNLHGCLAQLGGFDVANFLCRFLADETGATAIEYAMIAFGIAVAIVTTVTALGSAVQGKFDLLAAATG
jgi:pilus assembly protein Flp/PilA